MVAWLVVMFVFLGVPEIGWVIGLIMSFIAGKNGNTWCDNRLNSLGFTKIGIVEAAGVKEAILIDDVSL